MPRCLDWECQEVERVGMQFQISNACLCVTREVSSPGPAFNKEALGGISEVSLSVLHFEALNELFYQKALSIEGGGAW